MPRETFTAPATLPLFPTAGASRTSTTRVLPLAIISRACAGVIRGTAALAASIICLTLVAMASSSLRRSRPSPADAPAASDRAEGITARTALQRYPKSGETQPSATRADRAGVDRGHVFTLPERLKTGHKLSCRGAAGVRNHALSRSSIPRQRVTTRLVIGGPAPARRGRRSEREGEKFLASLFCLCLPSPLFHPPPPTSPPPGTPTPSPTPLN